MKRTIAFLMAIVMLVAIAGCTTSPQESPAKTENTAVEPSSVTDTPLPDAYDTFTAVDAEELLAALKLGLAPEDLSDPAGLGDGTVSVRQMKTLCGNVIEALGGDAPGEWANLPDDQELTRAEAAIMLYEATEALQGFPLPSLAGYGNLTYGSSTLVDDKSSDCGIFEPRKVRYGMNELELKNAAVLHACLQSRYYWGFSLIDPDTTGVFRCNEPMRRDFAVIAAFRLYQALCQPVQYQDLDTAAQDCTLTSEQLVHADSRLPHVVDARLPEGGYRGMTAHRRWSVGWTMGDCANSYLFNEGEMQWLADNGVNFYRVMLGLSTLGFPDCPVGLVSDKIMANLDQLVAWGIQYDICINLCIAAEPGHTAKENIFCDTNFYYDDPAQMELMREYTLMLAKRYNDVPADNLIFALDEESSPADYSVYNDYIIALADDIWAINPDRALTISVFSDSWHQEMVEPALSHGLNIACNLYVPDMLTHFEQKTYTQQFCRDGYRVPSYPAIYLPSILEPGNETLTIDGEIGGKTLGFYVRAFQPGSRLTVTADGKTLVDETLKAGSVHESEINYYYDPSDEAWDCCFTDYIAEIPEGTQSVSIRCDGTLQFSRLHIGEEELIPTTFSTWVYHETDWRMPTLSVQPDGSVITPDGHMADRAYVEEWVLRPLKETAEKCNTGLIISEFGIFPTDFTDLGVQLAYNEEMLSMFEDNGLSWCFNNYLNPGMGLLASSLLTENMDFLYDEYTRRPCIQMPYMVECGELVDQFRAHCGK